LAFDNNVFVNCPFDHNYKPILKSIYFCLTYLGYYPLLSETRNSAESRITSIQDLIENAKFSIHDLSRMQSTKKNELARFNMPFELGMDLGCKRFGQNKHREKCLLILDKERYRYQQAISDISGNDIQTHGDSPEKALRQVRNWLFKQNNTPIDSANKIWNLYNEFNGDFWEISQSDELSQEDIYEMPWDEYRYYILQWMEGRENFE
jgi:hypothetical protein